jgi:hypothetical protein
MSLRRATTADEQLAFHRRALAGAREEIFEDRPECGFWKMRLVKLGAWLPVRIWIEQEIDEAGDLLSPPVVKCTLDGEEKDPRDVWTWCSQRPIEQHEYRYMTALRAWQRINEPDLWDPRRSVAITETPIEE